MLNLILHFWIFGLSLGGRLNIVLFVVEDLDATLGGLIPFVKTREWLKQRVI